MSDPSAILNDGQMFYAPPEESLRKRRFIEYRDFYIKPHFPQDHQSAILDIGCGYGLFVDSCRKLGYTNAEGVDSIKQHIDLGETITGKGVLFYSPANDYLSSKGNDSYDVITAFHVIEHIPKAEVVPTLSEIYSKIKPGGMLILETPNAESPVGLAAYYRDLTHEFAYGSILLRKVLELAGFKEITIIPRFVNSNPIIRFGQKVIAKIFGRDNKLFFSSSLTAIAKK